MAFWAADDPFDLPHPPDQGVNADWGFDAVDGGNQDWGHWLAALEDPHEQYMYRRGLRPESTEAVASFHQNRSPSPEHGAYATWMTGNHPPSTRDAASRRRNSPLAASSSRPANPLFFSDTRQPRPTAATTSNLRQPEANHSSDWIDPTEARRPPREPHLPQPYAALEVSDADATPSVSSHESDYSNGIDIDDLLNDSDSTAMPPSTRRTQRDQPRNSIVDLTNEPSSPRSRKRARDVLAEANSSAKRRRTSNDTSPNPLATTAVEELDLTTENPSAEEELLQTQQAAAIAAQQRSTSEDPDKPLRVGQRTCIICMEPYTNATITSCGHIYCHECLTQALMAGEKNSERGVGNCPVCRKPVQRKKERQMIPVNFMKKEAWKGNGKRAVKA